METPKFKRLIVAAFIFGAICQASNAWADPSGIWSAKGKAFQPSGQSVPLYSPDHRSFIEYTGQGVVFRRGQEAIPLDQIVSAPALTEIIWSPRGDGFIVNASDGGDVGTWDSFLYRISGNRLLKPISVREVLRVNKTSKNECEEPEYYNVAAIGWMNDSKILVVRQVPPHSSCQKAGEERGYMLQVREGQTSKIPVLSRDLPSLKRQYGLKSTEGK